MTREGEELTRERMRGTDESPRRLWERSSSERFVKEAKGEIHMATTKRIQWESERKTSQRWTNQFFVKGQSVGCWRESGR